MWGRRITSGTSEYKTTKDVLSGLLNALIEKDSGGWAHFEVVAETGFFSNHLRGKQPWVEVALTNEGFFELNIGVRKTKIGLIPAIPNKWPQKNRNLYAVPMTDSEKMLDWIIVCLAAAVGKADFKVTGWLDGF